jgi:hypothetical protein
MPLSEPLESLPDLLCRISECTKDENVRKAISAFHQDQGEVHLGGTAHLRGEGPRTSHKAESQHHEGNSERRRMSRVRSREKTRKALEIKANITKFDTRREKACKIRRAAWQIKEELYHN